MGVHEPGDVKTLYDEVCRRHDAIADFRARLLTLLPIASGAGIFLLVGREQDAPTLAALPHLLPIGAFGVLVTLGLFLYELRGIQECRALIIAAMKLEQELLPKLWHCGAFNSKPAALFRIVGAAGAALVIYPAVVGAWVYVAGVGAVGTLNPQPRVMIAAAAGAGVAFGLGVAVNCWPFWRAKRKQSPKAAQAPQRS